MKNSTKFTLFIIGASLIIYGVYKWRVDSTSETSTEAETVVENMDDQESHVEKPVEPTETPANLPPASTDPVDQALIQQKFAAGLKTLGTCFNLSGDPGDKVAPNFQNLSSFVQKDMGDAISMSELWTNTDIELPNGEKRRIRIEMDYAGEESVTKRLKYFTLDAQGLQTPMPLSPEQSENASDAFIASLETDGQIFSKTRSVTAYYPNFSEMEFVEKDGHLVSVEILMGESGKFSCNNLDNNNASCQCH